MDGATTGGANQSLIDDPTFASYLDDLDRGLRTNNRTNDEEELSMDRSPASPQRATQSPSSPLPGLSSPPTPDLADDPSFRASLDALDWGLADDDARHEPATSRSPTLVPPLLRPQPPPTPMSSAAAHAPVARAALVPPPAASGARPLLDLFPFEPAVPTRAFTAPAAQTRARPLRRDGSEPAVPPFSDVPDDDSDLSEDPTAGNGDWSESRSPRLTTLGFAAFMLVMMLLGASISALVFHTRVSRIIVQWQSVSASASPPAAAHPNSK
jgi:hypothetical protein